MGFLGTPKLAALLNATANITEAHVTDFDAIVVRGDQGPMFTVKEAIALHRLFPEFYKFRLSSRTFRRGCHRGMASF